MHLNIFWTYLNDVWNKSDLNLYQSPSCVTAWIKPPHSNYRMDYSSIDSHKIYRLIYSLIQDLENVRVYIFTRGHVSAGLQPQCGHYKNTAPQGVNGYAGTHASEVPSSCTESALWPVLLLLQVVLLFVLPTRFNTFICPLQPWGKSSKKI